MKKNVWIFLLSLVSATALAAPSSTTVTFSKGTEGWEGVGEAAGYSWVASTPGRNGAAYYTNISDIFGLTWRNRSNQAFIGDYGQARSVTIGIDVKVNSILFEGRQVERHLVVELRDYDNPYNGMPYTSVWYDLGPISRKMGNWQHMSVTIPDTRAVALPAGWGGYGNDVSLPPGRTFANVLASVDEVAFTTYVPGYMYGFTSYDVVVDNISIATTAR